MENIKTFSLARHSRLFSVPDTKREYLFVSGGEPYHEEPYRAESYAMVLVRAGGLKLNAGLNSWDVIAPSIITLGPSVIRYFTKASEQLEMDVIFFKETFLLEHHADHFFLAKYDFFENSDLHVLPIEESYAGKLASIYDLIRLAHASTTFHQAEIIRSYIFALIYEIDGYYRLHNPATNSPMKGNPLATKFRQLLRNNYMQHRGLEFYADHLHLTPKSLSAAIKKQTGKSAGKWIDDAITLEAKVLLQNKTLTVSQVGGMLNFSDQSVFGKFFRANAGMSPIEYRKQFD
jgi:AraC family transcriptional activator of pobA